MSIEPETKDWTWVLQQPCPECGFDASTAPATDVPALAREVAGRWVEILAQPADRLRARWSGDRWTALEYACHVRDVFRICDWRLNLMLAEDDPDFPNWDQDASAVDERYNDQDPVQVSRDLAAHAERFAADCEAVSGDGWQRTGNRSDGARFTIEGFARYVVHDPIHHVWDVDEGLAQLATPAS
jgi:DinB family protein